MKAIVAMQDGDRVMGRDGDLPWHLPADLKHFKRSTRGGVLVMGRRTWQSLPGVLPGRPHLVLSRSLEPADLPAGVELLSRTEEIASRAAADERPWWIIGGAGLFEDLLDQIDEIVLTRVFGNYPGDTFMPEFESRFECVETGEREGEFRIERWQAVSSGS